MAIENIQELAAYEAGVRVGQGIVLSSTNWGVLPPKPALVTTLGLISTAFSRVSAAFDLPDDLLEQCRELIRDAARCVRRTVDHPDAYLYNAYDSCNWRLRLVEQLLRNSLESRSHARNRYGGWFRLGVEVPKGTYDNPADVPPGCPQRRQGAAQWIPDHPELLNGLLIELGVEISYIFPEDDAQAFCPEVIPDLPQELSSWGEIEVGLERLRQDGQNRVSQSWDEQTEARNRFVYDQYLAKVPLKEIVASVRKNLNWDPFDSVQNVRKCAIGYAKEHNLSIPPGRRGGRTKATKK